MSLPASCGRSSAPAVWPQAQCRADNRARPYPCKLEGRIDPGYSSIEHPSGGTMGAHTCLAMNDKRVNSHDLVERRDGRCPTLPSSRRRPMPRPGRACRCRRPQRRWHRSSPPVTTSVVIRGVAFEDKYLQTVVGTIVRLNDRPAGIDLGTGRTGEWPLRCCATSSTSVKASSK